MKTLLHIIDTTGTKNVLNKRPIKDERIQKFTEIEICLDCGGEVEQKFSGDEGWGICNECGTIEGSTTTAYQCSLCFTECETEECNCKLP